MSWDTYHHREEAVREAVRLIDRTRDGHLPFAESRVIERAFETPEDLLLALQMRWHRRLMNYVEAELAEEPLDLEEAAARAWHRTARDLPGVRAVLDAHDDDPVLATGRRKDLCYLASAAGLAGLDDPNAEPLGLRVRSQQPVAAGTDDDEPREGWLERLIGALVA